MTVARPAVGGRFYLLAAITLYVGYCNVDWSTHLIDETG